MRDESVWVKCPACSGSGKSVIDGNLMAILLSCAKLRAKDRGLMAQGVCLVCRGKAQICTHKPGIIRSLYYKIFG